jgi:transcriptional regulator with XRE-family HTH domain
MARPTIVRTNIARLRLALSMNQGGFAKLLGRSMAAVQSLEIGRLRLSRQLAGEIAGRTGVNPRWLLDNHLDESPYDMGGKPWSAATFHRVKDELPHHLKEGDEVFRQRMLELGVQLAQARNLAGLRRVYRALENAGLALEMGRRVDQFLASLMAEMDIKPDVNMMEEIRYAEHEAERKSQNVLRVMGVAQTQRPALSAEVPAFVPAAPAERRPRGLELVGAAWRK